MEDEQHARAVCITLVSLLRASQALSIWALMLSCAAALMLMLPPATTSAIGKLSCWGVLACGAWERYGALRLRLDAALFDAWIGGSLSSLAPLDAAMQTLGLRRQAQHNARSLDSRIQGARRQWLSYLLVLVCQSALFFTTLLIGQAV